MQWDKLWLAEKVATFAVGAADYGLIQDAVIATVAGKIAWVGSRQQLAEPLTQYAREIITLPRGVVMPGFIDCHTHLVYAGHRYAEFVRRLQGETYASIAASGGGIQTTVRATRAASFEELLADAAKRAQALWQQGVTTVEIKSGYGLDIETELRLLAVAKKLGEIGPLETHATYLGAHALPTEYRNNSDSYIQLICHNMIPRIAAEKLATAVDVYCEKIAFSLAQTDQVFACAAKYGLRVKVHAEQLSLMGATKLAARYQALSADHLEYTDEASVAAMAASGMTAVLLPAAFYFLQETQKPPIELLRKYQVPIAIATDCNSGTAPTTSLLLMLNMACTLFGLTPEEALLGITRHAAQALGLSATHGDISAGKQADFVCWDIQHPAELAYHIGAQALPRAIVKRGCDASIFG